MIIPTFLSTLVRAVIIMSVTGGAITLLLLAIKPLVRHRLPKAAQYYFWTVALMAFMVPFSLITLPERAANTPSIHNVVERNVISISEEMQRPAPPVSPTVAAVPTVPSSPATLPAYNPTQPAEQPVVESFTSPAPSVVVSTILMFFYPWVVLLIVIFNLVGYVRFTKKLSRSYIPANPTEQELLSNLCAGKRAPKIFRSKIAATPMLIGIFRPIIVLPCREYKDTHLHSILLHELTHMRRFDIAVKWLALAACAIHWFNPLVWLARQQIDRACELSCDEIVTRGMNAADKQNYGNTLIDLATDTKLPSTVLSTTMCQEKQALKERLVSIMKSKRHTKFAVFISMVIILATALGACGIGAARNINGGEESDITEEDTNTDEPTPEIYPEPLGQNYIDSHDFSVSYEYTPNLNNVSLHYPEQLDYAEHHIFTVAVNIHPSPYVRVVQARVDRFDKVAEFGHIFTGVLSPRYVELWRLEFAIQVEELNDEVRWGTFEPDADGWISQATSLNDANTILAFTRSSSGAITFEGAIPWYMDWSQARSPWETTPWEAELTARTYFESIGRLRQVTLNNDGHRLIYFTIGGQEARMLVSLFVQGENPIWVVDRWHSLASDHIDFAPPLSTELSMMEYYSRLQAQVDAGYELWRTDPIQVAQDFLNRMFPGSQTEIIGDFWEDPGVNLRTLPRSLDNHQRNFALPPEYRWPTPIHSPEYIELRNRIIAEIGGLAYNEAYQFRMEDGRYGLITGWRPFTGRAELLRYFPNTDIPEQLGDFRLVSVNVTHDRLANGMVVYTNPHTSVLDSFGHWWYIESTQAVDIPLDEVFTLDLMPIPHSLYAVYVNNSGQYVGLGVFPPVMAYPSAWLPVAEIPFSTMDMGSYGNILFIGEPGMYTNAVYEDMGDDWRVIELSFIDPANMPALYFGVPWGEINYSIPVPREALEELVQVFNPAALLEAFDWELVSFQ